jgi:hypothetical protein
MASESPLHSKSVEIKVALGSANSVSEFLKVYTHTSGISYAEISRRAGFSSRSYPRDVADGRRRLTAKSLPSLLSGLRLDRALQDWFQILYFKENPDEFRTMSPKLRKASDTELKQALDARIRKLHSALARGPVRSRPAFADQTLAKKSFSNPQNTTVDPGVLLQLVAAIPDPKTGATLEEIIRFTGISKSKASEQLTQLVALGILTQDQSNNRFGYPGEHVDLTGLGQNDLMKKIVSAATERAHARVASDFGKPETLYLASCLSVRSSDLPKIKAEIREILLKYIDRQVPVQNPDTVITLTCSVI